MGAWHTEPCPGCALGPLRAPPSHDLGAAHFTLPYRLESIGAVEAAWFDRLALVTILVNCGTMAWESPLDPPGTWKAHLIDVAEHVPPAGSKGTA